MKELAQRKRLLAAESELNRQALRLELHHIQTSLAGVIGVVRSGRSLWRALLVAAPMASLLASRRKSKWPGLLKAVLAGWQMFRRFQPLWAAFKQGRQAGEAASPPEAGSQTDGAA